MFLLGGLGNIASPYAAVYLILRFLVAAGGMGAYLVAYVLGKFKYRGGERELMTKLG